MKVRAGLWVLVATALFGAVGGGTTARAGDPGTGSTLFQLTNQDRSSNGLGALAANGTLNSIAVSARSGNCGGVNGRSEDMIERNYFAHQIPPCGQYVWQVFSLGSYTAAGENIGWNNYPPAQSVGQINTAFMNSPEHRANILGNYNQMGTGVWAATGPWSGAGGPYNGVIMYTEIFINHPSGGGTPPPPPPPPPPPVRRPPPTTAPAPTTAPSGGGTPAPTPVTSATAAPSPSASAPTCPVATDIGEADRNSPAPTLAPDGGAAPCPTPNVVGPAPTAGPTVGTITGSIDANSNQLTVSDASRLQVGDTVTIAGAGAGGADLVTRVVSISGKTITLAATASSAVKDAAVQVQAPAEVLGAEREASHRGILETVVDQVLRLFLNV